MLAVLATIVLATALVSAIVIGAYEAATVSSNRAALLRAEWLAEACAARTMSIIDDGLGNDLRHEDAVHAEWHWLFLAREVQDRWYSEGATPLDDSQACSIRLEPTGTGADINTSSVETLLRLFEAIGHTRPVADTLVSILQEWRAASNSGGLPTTTVQPAADRRSEPVGYAPISSWAELDRLPAWAHLLMEDEGWHPGIEIEAGRLCIVYAAPEALEAILEAPGPHVARLVDIRDQWLAYVTPIRTSMSVIPPQQSFVEAVQRVADPDIAAMAMSIVDEVVIVPDAWLLTSVGRDTLSGRTVERSLELKLVRAGARAAIIRRRFDP